MTTNNHLTLGLITRGLASEDTATRRAAIDLVRTRELASQTAKQILASDEKARAQFPGPEPLAAFLRGRAGLMSAASLQANRS